MKMAHHALPHNFFSGSGGSVLTRAVILCTSPLIAHRQIIRADKQRGRSLSPLLATQTPLLAEPDREQGTNVAARARRSGRASWVERVRENRSTRRSLRPPPPRSMYVTITLFCGMSERQPDLFAWHNAGDTDSGDKVLCTRPSS